MENDLSHLLKIANRRKQQLKEDIKQIQTDPTAKWDFPKGMIHPLRILAFKDLLVDQNVPEFKKKAYLIGKCWEAVILAEPYNQPGSPRYSSLFDSVKISVDKPIFYWALVSEHTGLIESIAHLMGYKGEAWEKENGGLEHVMMGFVIKYLLLRDDSRAESYLVRLEKETNCKKHPQYWYTYVRLLRGIWEGDQAKVQSDLETACKQKPLSSYSFDDLINIPAIGFGWLAKYRGLDVKVNHRKVPGEVFEHHEIDYPEADFLFPEVRDKTWQDLLEGRYP